MARGSDTDGALGAWTGVIAAGTGPPWHTHSREAELFHVIEGTFRFWCGDEAFTLATGATIVLPPHVPHHFRNVGSTPGRLLTVVAPGGFEQNFLDLAALPVITDADVAAIDDRLGVTDGPIPIGAQPD